jgi:hypothetical protein
VIAIIGFIASIVANIKSEEEKQASNKQLSDYQNALEHIDSSTKVIEGRTERQLQQVMAQLVVINPMEKWHAPNYAYPGSVIEIYNVASSTILEIRAVNDDFKLDIFCPEREFAKGIFYGESGKKIEWTVRSSEFFKGKIFLLSSPRTRDSKFSWEEEKITQ